MRKLAFLLIVLFFTASVYAVPIIESFFDVQVVDMQNVQGGGSGGAIWYYYENTNWWNIWFYDHPYKPDPWYKIVDYTISVQPLDPGAPSYFAYTLNWSRPAWSPNPDSPPIPPLTVAQEETFIQRDEPFFGFELTKPFTISRYDYILPVPYNPEWISIDIRGYNFQMNGTIWHECIPEPVTAMLLALGTLFINRRK